ncbi:hypothetical protein [Streptomyces sp. NRRL F-2747]|uniref:hypothetical protein n=1 Tax=Streptomyces sp. NRRL F-2747 TaxID=1463843 RepID=UPI0004CA26AB|nr:hypothetical protein [Streptomyces sp. NRRL F-2747]
MSGMEHKRQKPGMGREEQVREYPDADREPPEAGRTSPARTGEEARRLKGAKAQDKDDLQ